MGKYQLREKVIKEIYLIPLEKLDEVYDFIRFFRMGIEKTKTNKEKVLSFAGCWEDMPENTFNEFLMEIKHRRMKAFSKRRMSEASIN